MLCLICTLPIQNFKDENKLCQSCALRIKPKGDSKEEENFEDVENLEQLQKKLLLDLNLEGDSDYEAELEYLTQVKRSTLLNKQNDIRSSKSNESLPNDIQKFSKSVEKNKVENVLHATKSEILNNGGLETEFSNVTKTIYEQTASPCSHSNLAFFEGPKNIFQKLPDYRCDRHPMKEKPKRVSINNFNVFTISQSDTAENFNQSQTSIVCSCKAVIRPTPKHCEPLAQFQNIHSFQYQSGSCNTSQIQSSAYKNPVSCPVTLCKNIVPVSDFIKHFKLNHIRVPILPIDSGTCTNLFWDVKLDQFGISHCLMLLLTRGKVKQFAYGQYRDYLPIVIMTTKVKISELITDSKCDRVDDYFYMIWLTSMCTQDAEICYTIAAWSEIDDNQNGVHVVNTNQLYSLREDQNPKAIYRSGKAMILTKEQIRKLSNGFEKSVKLQVVIH